jgi:hypothetical protein
MVGILLRIHHSRFFEAYVSCLLFHRHAGGIQNDHVHSPIPRAALGRDLDAYVEQATDLKMLLEQLRVMLLARRAEVENNRAHMQVVARWAIAFQSTR